MRRAALLASCVALVAAGCDDPHKPPDDRGTPEPPLVIGPDEFVDALEHYYRTRDYERFADLLADDPDNGAAYEFVPAVPGLGTSWDRATELHVHRRMFDPDNPPAGEPAVPYELRLQAINISLGQLTPWQERADLYRSDTQPDGLPAEKWRAVDARFSTFVFFDTQTDNDFLVEGETILVVIEDLQKTGATPGRFLLLQWLDIDAAEKSMGVEEKSWTAARTLYLAPGIALSPDALIDQLASAYREMDHPAFARLLVNDPEHAAEFLFLLSSSVGGDTSWGYGEESRIHRRMFDPSNPQPGESGVPPEFWLQAINVSLDQVTPWTERPDLYRSDTNPTGLPPEKWKAVDARYATFVFFDTQTDNDFLVEDEAIFTIVEDLEKTGAEPGRFLLLQWQDIGDSDRSKEARAWSEIKVLYK